MATVIEWVKIVAEIIEMIAEGLSKDEAVSKAAKKYGVSSSDIYNKGGF